MGVVLTRHLVLERISPRILGDTLLAQGIPRVSVRRPDGRGVSTVAPVVPDARAALDVLRPGDVVPVLPIHVSDWSSDMLATEPANCRWF